MSFSWGVVSGCFIGPYIWGLFSKKITKTGAFAGILSGLITVGGATLAISLTSGFSAAAARSPEMGVSAMAVSMIVVPLVSAFTRNTEKESDRVKETFKYYRKDL
jgi:Na+(H+)/acetate symporter ActP